MYEIVRRGDYLELQITQREAPTEPKKRAEQVNPNIAHVEAVSVKDAINKFELPAKLVLKNNRIQNLKDSLREIERQIIADPKGDKSKLQEIKLMLADLADLDSVDNIKEPQPNFKKTATKPASQPPKEIKLMIPVPVDLEKNVSLLESLEYVKLQKLELILAVLVGQKFANEDKISKAKSLPRFDSLGPLYSRFQKLQNSIDEFPQLVERICLAEHTHSEVMDFSSRLNTISTLHHEMLAELNESSELAKRLKTNFEENKKTVQNHIAGFKARISRLKKKN